MRVASLVSCSLLLPAASALAADVVLTHQGRLLAADGTPRDGATAVTIALWSHATSTDSGTYRRYQEAFPELGIDDGYYTVRLGAAGGLDASLLAGSVWVEVIVGGTPLVPRAPLSAVPVAAQLASPPAPGVPTGAVMPFDLAACPSGWSEYLPARGRFVRGLDPTGVTDPDGATRTAGSLQGDEVKSHTHTSYYWSAETTVANARNNVVGNPGTVGGSTQGTWISDATGGAETRPKNVALLYCRKD